MVKKRGFTIIELIVAITVISFLMSLIVYGLVASRKKARTALAKSDMISLGHAVVAYHDSHKKDFDVNDQWPRSIYDSTAGVRTVPWELTEGGFWSKSEPIKSDIAYEVYPCSPRYGQNFDESTQQLGGAAAVSFDNTLTRKNACTLSDEPTYVGINWAGLNGNMDDVAGHFDNAFLLIYKANPMNDLESYVGNPDFEVSGSTLHYLGKYLLKMGGSDENCAESSCDL